MGAACVSSDTCEAGNQVLQCDAPTPPPSAGSTQFITSAAGSGAPGSQMAGREKASSGSPIGLVVGMVALVVLVLACVSFIVRKRRRNAMLPATEMTSVGQGSGDPAFRSYGPVPGEGKGDRKGQRSRARSRSSSFRGHHAPSDGLPMTYGSTAIAGQSTYVPAPAGDGWAASTYGPAATARTEAADSTYSALSMKQSTYGPTLTPTESAGSSYSSLSMKQSASSTYRAMPSDGPTPAPPGYAPVGRSANPTPPTGRHVTPVRPAIPPPTSDYTALGSSLYGNIALQPRNASEHDGMYAPIDRP